MFNNYMKEYGCILADDMGLGKTVMVTKISQIYRWVLSLEHSINVERLGKDLL